MSWVFCLKVASSEIEVCMQLEFGIYAVRSLCDNISVPSTYKTYFSMPTVTLSYLYKAFLCALQSRKICLNFVIVQRSSMFQDLYLQGHSSQNTAS